MRSLRVLRVIRSSEDVQSSLDAFGDRVADQLDRRHASPAEGGEDRSPAVYRLLFDDLGRDLGSLRGKVVAAEDKHVRRRIRVKDLRRRSEEMRGELYEQQVSVRRILAGAFGPERGFELAAVSGTTPRTLKALEEQVDQTVKLLRAPVDGKPAVRVEGVTVDLDRVADGLERKRRALSALRHALDRARKAVGESKVLLDDALREFQGSFPWIARALESHFRIAGEKDLAGLVRSAIRRVTRRRRAEPEELQALGRAPGDATDEPAPAEETTIDPDAATSTDAEPPATSAEPAGPEPLAFPAPAAPAGAESREERPARDRARDLLSS